MTEKDPRRRTGGRSRAGGRDDRNHHTPFAGGNPGTLRPPAGLVSASSVVENVLDRLAGVRRSPRGWIARCPAHEDRHQSLSVGEGRDDRALVNCFAGCEAADIVRAVQLELKDLFPPRWEGLPLPRRPRAKAKPYPVPRSIAQTLVESSEFAVTFEVAKSLAKLEPRQARSEVVASWGYLADCADIPALLEIVSLIRGVAVLRFSSAKSVGQPEGIARAVGRLVDEIERVAP